jgi:hypothetical protein
MISHAFDSTHMKPARIDYCRFLLSSQVNFTLTHHADHHAHSAMMPSTAISGARN